MTRHQEYLHSKQECLYSLPGVKNVSYYCSKQQKNITILLSLCTSLCVYVCEREREHNQAPDINETGATIVVPVCASIGNYSLTILIIWCSQFFPLCSKLISA